MDLKEGVKALGLAESTELLEVLQVEMEIFAAVHAAQVYCRQTLLW